MKTFRQELTATSRVFTIAARALLDHIETHDLPFPDDLYPDLLGGPPRLVVRVHGNDAAAWAASVAIDSETNERVAPAPGSNAPRYRTSWMVRLPDTGTRVEVLTTRPMSLVEMLAGVSA